MQAETRTMKEYMPKSKGINSVLNMYLHLNNIWSEDFTWCITDPFWYMRLNLLIKISCCTFCWWKRYPVSIFSRDTLNAGEKVNARFQRYQSCLLFHSSPRDIRRQKLLQQKGTMVWVTEQNQGVDEILRSSRISFLQLANRPMHMKTEVSGKLASKTWSL